MAITDRHIQARSATDSKWLSESLGRGHGVLQARITPNSERLFYFRYTDSFGVRQRMLVGPYSPKGAGGLTLAQARDKARELSALYRSGVKDLKEHFAQIAADEVQADADDRAQAKVRREAEARAHHDAEQAALRRVTVRRLFDQWKLAELTPRIRADGTRSGRKDGGLWTEQSFDRRIFPKLGSTHVEDVRKADLLAILDECKAGGHMRTANVLFADLRQMFRFAADRELVPRNPLDGIKRSQVGGKDTARDRVLSPDELESLHVAVPLANLHPRSALAIWLILATACRVGEAMTARWKDVNFDRATWYLPDTKNQRDHTIHLSPFALQKFQALKALREVGTDGKATPWLFPSTDLKNPVDVKTIGKQLADRQRDPENRLAGRTKSTDSLEMPGGRWTAHDLRRTAATMMAGAGVSTDVIDECLNHKLQSSVARVYIKDRRLQEQARAFDALSNRLLAIFEGRTAQVVQLHAHVAA